MKKFLPHLPYNARSRVGPYITIGFFLVVFGGCAASTSNLLNNLQSQPATPLSNFSDYGIITDVIEVDKGWGNQSLLNDSIGMTGALSLAGLSTALLATANTSPMAHGFSIAANGILGVMGVLKPGDREAIYKQASGLLHQALGKYVLDARTEGECSIPTDRISVAGANLFNTEQQLVKLVNDLLIPLIPQFGTVQIMGQPLSQVEMTDKLEKAASTLCLQAKP